MVLGLSKGGQFGSNLHPQVENLNLYLEGQLLQHLPAVLVIFVNVSDVQWTTWGAGGVE